MKSRLLAVIFLSILPVFSAGQFRQIEHRAPLKNEIPVDKPGIYDIPGATYILVKDIVSPRTAIFLGKDVTLDLNGFSVTFAGGNYSHIPNSGFEEGTDGWDFSRAPGARIAETTTHAFIGEKLLSLATGDEIVSGYVFLPERDRSYFAMCGVTGRYYNEMNGDLKNDMRISIFVEDGDGNEVRCITGYADTTLQGCPVLNYQARLGGGFVYAHLDNLVPGKYRVRVKAETDCLIDELDIRPAMDAGIAIVGKTHPRGHYYHAYNNLHSAFFDYTAVKSSGKPKEGIPAISGTGTVTVRNGSIINGVKGIMSCGIQSTAENVKIIIDNVSIISSGINTTAVDVPRATITNCSFDIDNPFIINRHGSEFYAVDLTGEQPSEVSFSEFRGGQGCLSFKGKQTSVHHNLFINRQTVTNHYSIMAMGDGSRIFSNKFMPEIGSGIEIFRRKYIEIFGNEFHIKAAPPSCEYADHLSTNAIRIADYGAAPGAANGAFGNRVYNNRFYITGRKYRQYPDFIPMASAFFYSASAGENEIFGNEIIITQEDPETDAEAWAFYIGNSRGGSISGNRIVTNVTPVWIACSYGKAENTVLSSNTFEMTGNGNQPPLRMGSSNAAMGIELRSNLFTGQDFRIDANNKPHSYKVFWTITINLRDKKGDPSADTGIVLTDQTGNQLSLQSDKEGIIVIELPAYSVNGDSKIFYSPYSLSTGRKNIMIPLDRNTVIDVTTR